MFAVHSCEGRVEVMLFKEEFKQCTERLNSAINAIVATAQRKLEVFLCFIVWLLGCDECMRCRLLLPMIAVSVRRSVSLSVTRLNSAVRAVCAGSFGAAFAKLLWLFVLIVLRRPWSYNRPLAVYWPDVVIGD